MKKILCFTFLFTLTFNILYCQVPIAGTIDYYGRGISAEACKLCLNFNENDSVAFVDDDIKYAAAKTKIEKCLLKISKVKQAEITFVCCTLPDNYWMIYAGADTTHQTVLTSNFTADVRLPKSIHSGYKKINDLLFEAIEKNEATEDIRHGHAIMLYEPVRKIQLSYIAFADTSLKLLKNVLANSKYAEEREVAATVIGYYHNKKLILNDLLKSISDPDVAVRNNAIRTINIITDYANSNQKLDIKINPDPFINLLNSISWTDRNKSSLVLLSLTEDRDTVLLEKIKKSALESIIDMATWKNFGHSLPGYILLGRIIGWQEQVIMSGVNNERNFQVQEMLKYLN